MATGEGKKPESVIETTLKIGTDSVDLADITSCYASIEAKVEVYVPLPDGRTLTLEFEPLPRRKEYDALLRRGSEIYQTLPKIGSAGYEAHSWKDFYPQDVQEFIEAFVIAELSLSPKIPLETALVWLANPNLVKNMVDQIESQSKTIGTIWIASLTEAKKKSLSLLSETAGSPELASDEQTDSLAS